MTTVFANALTDLFKSVIDNPTAGGVVGLVIVGLIVYWALNADKTPGGASPRRADDRVPASEPPPKTEDQKEKEAVQAALKAYKDAKK
jgi:hypothetical protein